jgi:hypothetical protein
VQKKRAVLINSEQTMRGTRHTATRVVILFGLVLLASLLCSESAQADVATRGLPASLVKETLEDPLPTAFDPASFSSEDFD